MKLLICHLYPDLMNTYGDRGNILVLSRRAAGRGISVEIAPFSLGERCPYEQFDLIFFGGGQDKDQRLIAEDLSGEKGRRLAGAAESGSVILAVCGGYQLLGAFYRTKDGTELPGIGLFDAFTTAGSERLIGDVTLHGLIPLRELPTIVGFENHSGRTHLGSKARPLGRVLSGHGNNGKDGFEGCVFNNAIGTYLHGPLLPRNPHFADYLIAKALNKKNGEVALTPLNDELEIMAHKAALPRAARLLCDKKPAEAELLR